jgi:cysteine protease ATG4
VLVLVGIRLSLGGINPVYYDTIKVHLPSPGGVFSSIYIYIHACIQTLYMFPQSVGIAGGRPSSSYYFVSSQVDNLFYLNLHHACLAVPLRPPSPSPFPTLESQPMGRFWQTMLESIEQKRQQQSLTGP